MDTSELIINLYEGTYEQDDLVPYDAAGAIDLTLPGSVKLLQAINRATRTVSTWKFPNGERNRLASSHGQAFVTTPETGYDYLNDDPTEATSAAAGWIMPAGTTMGLRTINLPASAPFIGHPDNYYAGWLLYFYDDVSYLVISSTGVSVTLLVPLAEDRTGHPFRLHPTSLTIGGQAGVDLYLPQYIAIKNIHDFSSGFAVERANGNQTFPTAYQSVGAPTTWYVENNKIYFNSALMQPISLLIHYWKFPRPVTALGEMVDLPESFHEVVLLLAKSEIFRRVGEVAEADSAFRNASHLMMTLRTEADMTQDLSDSRLYPEA